MPSTRPGEKLRRPGAGGSDREVDTVFGRVRAEAAKKLLVEHGISADRIRMHSAGSDEPLAPNDSERYRSRNRPVVLRLYSL